MGIWPNSGIRALNFPPHLLHFFAALIALLVFSLPQQVFAQDGSSALNGVVEDITGARVASAAVAVVNPENGFHREAVADAAGNFSFGMLLPGRYVVSAWAKGMATQTASVELFVGGVKQVQLRLRPIGKTETITVIAQAEGVEAQSSDVSHVIPQQAIENLPLDGRRFT